MSSFGYKQTSSRSKSTSVLPPTPDILVVAVVERLHRRLSGSATHRWWRVGGCGREHQHRPRVLPVRRFGGSRPYFICPGVVNGISCGRRVVKLHGSGRYFLCRHCYRLVYASQSEGDWDRALRRINRIRQRLLGGEPGMAFPDRSKGMRRQTYERLRDEDLDAETRANESFIIQAERLPARFDKPKRQRNFWP